MGVGREILPALSINQNTTNMKKFVLTYVGLSDDYEANGYSEVFLFNTFDEAKEHMKTLSELERFECDTMGREYEILEDTEDEFRMSWSGHGEQIRLQIHEINS